LIWVQLETEVLIQLIILMMYHNQQQQYTYFTITSIRFQQLHTFVDFDGGVVTKIANPDKTGVNTSATVAKW
jgi:hypothetical protein